MLATRRSAVTLGGESKESIPLSKGIHPTSVRSNLHGTPVYQSQYVKIIRKCIRPYLWKYEFRNGCLLNLEGDTGAQSRLKAIRHETLYFISQQSVDKACADIFCVLLINNRLLISQRSFELMELVTI